LTPAMYKSVDFFVPDAIIATDRNSLCFYQFLRKNTMQDIINAIRDVPDFPSKGIIFKDITPILKDTKLFSRALDLLQDKIVSFEIDYICGIESRGFIFAAALADRLNKGFIPIRKPGKLPADTYSESYELEYGKNTLEIHKDALNKDDRVVIIDDLLATGGTVAAANRLIERCNASVVLDLFLVELDFLLGRNKLTSYTIESIINFS